jgi:hypothetical protein
MARTKFNPSPSSSRASTAILQCLRNYRGRTRRQGAVRLRIRQPRLGLASLDSDYDVRFVEPGRDVIEQPISGEAGTRARV